MPQRRHLGGDDGLTGGLHATLLQWYAVHGRRELPWRQTDDPYRIWISEIMLQQTQVKTVLERFYFPFLETFPTLTDLAAADRDAVLKQWEGLGYYTRARNLHKAAQQCGATLPQTVDGLIALPGIGKSTAHAIAAFAYRTPVAILDANVKRILYRFHALKAASDKVLWGHAEALMDPTHPFEYNQAMMDVGATLCLPKRTECDHCPLASGCRGQADPTAYPAPKKRKAVPVRHRHIVVYQSDGRYGMRQRTGRFLHGLWQFIEADSPPEAFTRHLGSVTQTYSHFRLEAEVYLIEAQTGGLTWYAPEEFAGLALSGAEHKIVKLLQS